MGDREQPVVSAMAPRVFTLPPGVPFAESLAEALFAGTLIGSIAEDPLALSDLTIYLPTRRAVPVVEAALAAAGGRAVMALPRLVPLADLDTLAEEQWLGPGAAPVSTETEDMAGGEEEAGLPVPIDPLERRFLLMALVAQWSAAIEREGLVVEAGQAFRVAASPAAAFTLAADLGRLIDEMALAGVPLSRLAEALPESYDPDRFDRYWDLTRRFLAIAAGQWPAILAERGVVDAASLTDTVLRREAERLTRAAQVGASMAGATMTPRAIVAGSTGSVRATALLMRAVARLPQGAVVLPGLDLAMPEVAFAALDAERAEMSTRYGHPQAILKRTLGIIGVPRAAVRPLAEARADRAARAVLVSTALLPAETSELWRDLAPALPRDLALSGVAMVEAADDREEGLVVALALREALEHPGRTAALVTPDRQLAARVAVELRRWGLGVADSAGTRLAEHPAGVLALLALDVVEGESARAWQALLRHGFVRCALAVGDAARAIDALELLALRAGVPASGGLAARLGVGRAGVSRRSPAPLRRVNAARTAEAAAFAGKVDAALAPLFALPLQGPPAAMAEALVGALESLCRRADGSSPLEEGGGVVLTEALRALAAAATPPMSRRDGRALIDLLLRESTVPPYAGGHARLKILGPLESRLVSADRVVVGGLNEGVFPPEARDDAFLNRAMRMALGLDVPERRIGQSAHDFAMLLGAPEVVLTRAVRSGGAPMVPSRFLLRLQAVAGESAWAGVKARGEAWRALGEALETPIETPPAPRPSPVPAAPRVPAALNVTEVETLYRDPFALYARALLDLQPLEAPDAEPDARLRGTIVHEALAAFALARDQGPAAALGVARQKAQAMLAAAPLGEWAPFWQANVMAAIDRFATWDETRRPLRAAALVEQSAGLDLSLLSGDVVTLRTRADRIEIEADGALAIFDVKTGLPPSAKTVLQGLSPQLPLTAAMARAGAFADLPAGHKVRTMGYLALSASATRAGGKVLRDIVPAEGIDAFAESQRARLVATLNLLATGARGYTARAIPRSVSDKGDYDHLARRAEWAVASDDAEDEGDGEGAQSGLIEDRTEGEA